MSGRLPLTAVVLAGGAGRRMGTDKARLPWRDGTLLGHVVGRLQEVATELLIVGGRGYPAGELPPSGPALRSLPGHEMIGPVSGWRLDLAANAPVPRFVPDPDLVGPLGGLRLGLAAATPLHSHVALVACDMPFLEPAALRRLWALAAPGTVVMPRGPDGLHPLLALYPRDGLPLVEDLLAQGRRRPTALLDHRPVRFLDTLIDPAFWTRVLTNLNSPQDYEVARATDRRSPPPLP